MTSFATVAAVRSEGGLRFQDLEGSLLILTVTGVQRDVPSEKGETFDAVVCDVSVVDGDHAGTSHVGMWFIGKALVNQLGPHVGGIPVLGRLTVPAGKRYRTISTFTAEDEAAAVAAFPAYAVKAPESDADASVPAAATLLPLADTPPF